MKLTVLVDNNTIINKYLLGEPGLSFYIESGSLKLLLDTGYSDVFIKNACKLGINLKNLNYIVLSHGHNDHTNGLIYLKQYFQDLKDLKIDFNKPEILAHPYILNQKFDDDIGEMGFPFQENQLSKIFILNTVKSPFYLSDNLIFLGEIPRVFEFENSLPDINVNINGNFEQDKLLDDTALVYRSQEGLVIIVGCAHSGICNIVEYAKQVCNEERIVDIIGGFHLLKPENDRLEKTREYLSKQHIKTIHPCHCTSLHSKIFLAHKLKLKEVGAGKTIKY